MTMKAIASAPVVATIVMTTVLTIMMTIVATPGLEIVASAQANETIFKWTDEDGVVHYAAHPPEGVDYVELGVDMTPDAAAVPPASEPAEARAAAAQPPELPEMTRTEPDPKVVAERCEQARSNIENLVRHTNIVVSDEDGQQRALSREQRQQMVDETQAFIDEWC